MREILFRGKRLDNNEWACGSLFADYADCSLKEQGRCVCSHDGSLTYIFVWDDEYHEHRDIEVDYSTVGQYTGLRDKNGQRIFEGDVVRGKDVRECGRDIFGCVDHRDGSFVIVESLATHYGWIDYDVEVIGNIYDNPELMKGGTV